MVRQSDYEYDKVAAEQVDDEQKAQRIANLKENCMSGFRKSKAEQGP